MKNPSVIVYSTSWCQPCKFAKRLLDSKGLEYREIDIEEKGWSREDLFEITGGRTCLLYTSDAADE